VLFHAGGKCVQVLLKLGQRRGIAFRKLADATGEGLRNPIQLALHGIGQGRQPFVVHYKLLDLVLGQLGVLGIQLGLKVISAPPSAWL
jgi:hypothetical protein